MCFPQSGLCLRKGPFERCNEQLVKQIIYRFDPTDTNSDDLVLSRYTSAPVLCDIVVMVCLALVSVVGRRF